MAITTEQKWIIGIASFLGLAYLTRKKWLGKKSVTVDVKQDTVASSGGDASPADTIGQKYTLTSDYKATNVKTFQDVPFKKGAVFVKQIDRNGTMMNMQSAVRVSVGLDEFVIPTTLLKKSA